MRRFYGSEMPATSYIPQPPCDGKLISIEALGVGQGTGEVEIDRRSEQLVITRHNGIAWIHAAQAVGTTSSSSVYDQSLCAFRHLQGLFEGAGARYSQVIRTWLYLGGIVDGEGTKQRYKELNRARADFYNDIPFLEGRLSERMAANACPASTGIGTEGRGIGMSAIALVTERDDIIAVPLENPRQTAAYEYSDRYSPESPKFCRAMALSCGQYATIFISGTASITASETRHVGDAGAQTHETLENIAALISEDNVNRHGLPGLGTTLEGLALVRVYIKHVEDYPAVRAVCEQRLGELPTIYAIGDVCRPDLLVEIEGMAFSCKVPAAVRGDAPSTVDAKRGRPMRGETGDTVRSREAVLVKS
jgi:enamine deaminase RidA (YjgF/YER057c/UK114 family)